MSERTLKMVGSSANEALENTVFAPIRDNVEAALSEKDEQIAKLTKQRDGLLATMKTIRNFNTNRHGEMGWYGEHAQAAIAAVEADL